MKRIQKEVQALIVPALSGSKQEITSPLLNIVRLVVLRDRNCVPAVPIRRG
jgi:hypothetical protein